MSRTGAGDERDLEDMPDRSPSVVPAPADAALRPPLERRGMVRPAKLLARLDRAPAGSLILLVAPGGYGKTTVLSQWAASAAVCAWITADAADNDPGSLALHIALALRAALPLEAPALGLSDRLEARS